MEILIAIVLSLILGMRIGWKVRDSRCTGGATSTSEPKVIVNVPADLQPLSRLESGARVVTDEKAILWWTVYSKALDQGRGCFAADDADDAVETVYG